MAQRDEQNIINSLIDRGVELPFPKRSLITRLRLNFIREPYNGTLDRLSDIFVKMDGIDESVLADNPIRESNILIKAHNRNVARAIALSILNGPVRIFLFTRILTAYLQWSVKPSLLKEICMLLRQIMNAGDFITSIRLMSGIRRTTQKPDLIEENKQA